MFTVRLHPIRDGALSELSNQNNQKQNNERIELKEMKTKGSSSASGSVCTIEVKACGRSYLPIKSSFLRRMTLLLRMRANEHEIITDFLCNRDNATISKKKTKFSVDTLKHCTRITI